MKLEVKNLDDLRNALAYKGLLKEHLDTSPIKHNPRIENIKDKEIRGRVRELKTNAKITQEAYDHIIDGVITFEKEEKSLEEIRDYLNKITKN